MSAVDNSGFRVWLVNFTRYLDEKFPTLEEAEKAARKVNFESIIIDNGNPVKQFHPISGMKTLRNSA